MYIPMKFKVDALDRVQVNHGDTPSGLAHGQGTMSLKAVVDEDTARVFPSVANGSNGTMHLAMVSSEFLDAFQVGDIVTLTIEPVEREPVKKEDDTK